MRIVADEQIPLLHHYFGGYGDLVLKKGRELTRQDIMDADILIVRSVTPVTQALLEGTSVRFIGSVTTGDDHLDKAWLQEAQVPWYVARGCNSRAVVEYVISTIAALQKIDFLRQKKPRAAVIGVGLIGKEVASKLELLGFEVVQCDPIRAKNEKDFKHTPIEEIAQVDFITLHTPLTLTGDAPTFHLLKKDFFLRQDKGTILLNTGRGPVIDFHDLKLYGGECIQCLDVWEHEPYIDFKILDLALIATPHIAGHSIQSKYRAIQMVHDACVASGVLPERLLPPVHFPSSSIDFKGKKVDWRDIVLSIYDPMETTQKMKKKVAEEKNGFDLIRHQFYKNEFHFVTVENVILGEEDRSLLELLCN